MAKPNLSRPLFLLLFVMICRIPAFASSPELVVFFIHGVNSDSESFCEFPEVLKEQIAVTLGKPQALQATSLSYSTKHNEWGITDDFAVEIAAQIANYYESRNLSKSIPYTFVMHSQGGLVGKRFIENCLFSNQCTSPNMTVPQSRIPPNLVQYISLGTPHQGSSGATFLIRGLRGIFGEGKLLKMIGSQEQNASLAPGAIQFSKDRHFELANQSRLRHNIEFHNVIGVTDFDDYRITSRLSLGPDLESDMVVSASSARQDFHYCIMNSPQSPMQCGTSNLVNKSRIYTVNRKHSPLPFESDSDMKCVETGEPHPTLDIVRQIVLLGVFNKKDSNASIVRSSHADRDLKNFSVDIHVYLPEEMGRGIQKKDLKVFYRSSDFQDLGTYLIEGGIGHNYIGHTDHAFEYLTTTVQQNAVAYFHMGRIGQSSLWTKFRQGRLDSQGSARRHYYKLEYPGFEPVDFEVPISAGMTSFVKVYLKPSNTVVQSDPVGPKASNATASKAPRPSSMKTMQSHSINGFDMAVDPQKTYNLKTVKANLSRYRNLGQCFIGALAFRHEHGVALEPVRYTQFHEPERRPLETLDPSKHIVEHYLHRRDRQVRIHAAFKKGSLHRYLVSRPKGFGYQIFWVNAQDVDLLPQRIVDELEVKYRIHQKDVCR